MTVRGHYFRAVLPPYMHGRCEDGLAGIVDDIVAAVVEAARAQSSAGTADTPEAG